MLNPAQISSLKASMAPIAGSPAANAAVMTPDQAKSSFSPAQTTTPPVTPSVPTEPTYMDSVAKKLGGTVYETTKEVGNTANQIEAGMNTAGEDLKQGNVGSAAAQGLATAGRGVLSTFGDTANLVGSTLNSLVPDWLTQLVNNGSKALGDIGSRIGEAHPELSKTLNDYANNDSYINKTIQSLSDFSKTHPDAIPVAKDAISTMLLGVGAEDANSGFNNAKSLAKDISSKIPEMNNAVGESSAHTPQPEATPALEDSLIKESGKTTPEAARASAWNDIQPKATPSTKLAYAKAGNTTEQGLLTKGKLTPSTSDAKLLDSYGKLYEDGTIKDSMTPQEKQTAVQQRASQLNGQQKEFLAQNDKAVNLTTRDGSGLFDRLDATAQKSSLPFSKDAAAKGAYDSAIETFKANLKSGKGVGTVDGATKLTNIDQALTAFDKAMEQFNAYKRGATGEITDSALARQNAIRDIHTTARDFIANELPKNSPWKSIRLEESNMYQISDRLAQRVADTVGSSKVGAAIKSNPVIKAGVSAAATASGVGAAMHLVP